MVCFSFGVQHYTEPSIHLAMRFPLSSHIKFSMECIHGKAFTRQGQSYLPNCGGDIKSHLAFWFNNKHRYGINYQFFTFLTGPHSCNHSISRLEEEQVRDKGSLTPLKLSWSFVILGRHAHKHIKSKLGHVSHITVQFVRVMGFISKVIGVVVVSCY